MVMIIHSTPNDGAPCATLAAYTQGHTRQHAPTVHHSSCSAQCVIHRVVLLQAPMPVVDESRDVAFVCGVDIDAQCTAFRGQDYSSNLVGRQSRQRSMQLLMLLP